ncbi:MAG: hypothetical protein CMD64_00940 [Gammaproteobacteria bacterium]|nr:hypothetical protein [Gammaproteobacteria bacterium]
MIYIFLFFTALIYFFFLIKNSGEESRIKVQNKFIIITSLSLSFLFMIYFFNNSFIQDRDEIQRISQKHEKLRNDIVKIKSNIPSLIEKLERMPDYYVGWVMLARSYQLTGDKISASIAFDKALKIRDDEIDIIQEYIYLLKDLDPKRNKNKITKLFDKIITSNSNNINTYNMLLNYSVEINDIELTKNTLEKIINETDIENKKPYIDALKQISSQSNFGFTVRLSSKWIKSYNQMKHIFIILKEDNMPPIAVKRVLGEDLKESIKLSSDNIMLSTDNIKNKSIRLIIKSGETAMVNDQLIELYKSELFKIKNNDDYYVEY